MDASSEATARIMGWRGGEVGLRMELEWRRGVRKDVRDLDEMHGLAW